MKKYSTLFIGAIILLTTVSAGLLAQRPRTLIVNGRDVGPATLVNRGRTYVDVETLAQALNGSVTLQPDRVIFTLSGTRAGEMNTQGEEPASRETMSREFSSAALNAVTLMRDWRVVIATMISQQLPAVGTYFQDFQDRAEQGMRQAGVAAGTDSDQQAYGLLQNQFSNQARWAGNAIVTRQALDATRTMNPDYIKNDTDLQKITQCSNALGAMLSSLAFTDIPSCH